MASNRERRQGRDDVDHDEAELEAEQPDSYPPAVPIAVLIGRRIREAREISGVRQDDIAAAAADFGLKWGRSSVAALEAGTRKLSAEELVVLDYILTLAKADAGVELIKDHDRIKISDSFAIWGRHAKHALLGHEDHYALIRAQRERRKRWKDVVFPNKSLLNTPSIDGMLITPQDRLTRAQFLYMRYDSVLRALTLWPQLGEENARIALRDRRSEMVRKVAAKIDAPPDAVVFMSRALWGRTLTEERDGRTSERASETDPRALQGVRSYVTRQLTKELEDEWNSATKEWLQFRTKREEWMSQERATNELPDDAEWLERNFITSVQRATREVGKPLEKLQVEVQAMLGEDRDDLES